MIPGMETTSSKSYDYCSNPPDKVLDDIRMLIKGRALPKDFSFIGKKLPRELFEQEGGNEEDTEISFAMQSAYRLAYMHMSIDLDGEEGIIDDFEYSTYQSSGSPQGDMFSRPVTYDDRTDEAIDMLLHLYDLYTDEELEEL